MAWVSFLKQKSDTATAIQTFIATSERQFSTCILCFKSDHGREYINTEMLWFFHRTGIRHEPTPPYSHESNGIPERYNRTIQTMMRAMLLNLDKRLWAEACTTSVYLRNRLPHSSLQDKTPFEVLYNTKPTISHLQPFGIPCYIHIPEER